MPTFLANALGTRASATPQADDQWTARPTFFDPEDFRSGLEVVSIASEDLESILQKCRMHNVKLTGLLHQVIVQALSKEIPPEKAGSFVTQTSIDMRPNLDGLTADDMAVCSNAYYELFPRIIDNRDESSTWEAARKTTQELAKCAGTLNDQPVGLLRYLRSIYPWMKAQIGKPRESSYELSNILSFNPGPSDVENGWDIESMIFSQPACANSAPLTFNVVSKYKGDLVIVIGWQLGALDVEDEQAFAENVGASIALDLRSLARG